MVPWCRGSGSSSSKQRFRQIEIASGRADCLPLIEDQAHRAGFEDPNALQSVRVEMF
jgi:hypothetical protein